MSRSVSRPFRPGFSLMEMAVAFALISIVLVAIGTVIVVAGKAVPASASAAASNATASADAVVSQLLGEVRFATSITESTPTAVTFTVPDRNNDNTPETIRYSWSGTPGDPLMRTYNHGTSSPIIPAVSSLNLGYLKHKHTVTSTVTTTVDSGELQFATFSGWIGLLATSNIQNVSTTTWGSEAFVIDKVNIPNDATRIAITRVSLKMKKPASGTIGCTVAIHQPSSPGASTPASSPIGTPFSVPVSSLTTSFAWVDSTFSDVAWTSPSQTNFVIVVKGIASTTSASLNYLTSLTAPLDNTTYQWTTNSGSTWQPGSALNTNDAPFVVYGSYQRQVTTTANVDTYTLGSVSLSLQTTGAGAPRIDTAAEVLNEPSIAGP